MRDAYSSGPARGAGYGTLIAWTRFVPQLPEPEPEPPPEEPPPEPEEPPPEEETDPPPVEPPPEEPPPVEPLRRRAGRGLGPSLLSVPVEPVLLHGFGISVKTDGPGKIIATIDPALRSRYWTAHLSAFGANLLGSTIPVEIRSINEPEGLIAITAPDVADVVVSLVVIGCGS